MQTGRIILIIFDTVIILLILCLVFLIFSSTKSVEEKSKIKYIQATLSYL